MPAAQSNQPRPAPRPPGAATPVTLSAAVLAAMAARLAVAVRTLHALPPDSHERPVGTRSAWPDFMQKTALLAGRTRAGARLCPAPAAIDDLTHLVGLFWHLGPDQRRLVWARACGVPWAVLAARFARSRTSLNRDYKQALAILCHQDQQKK